ncbi:MAG: YihY/virulence factor BrkB family protein [Chloroflexota bacterium]
MANLKQGIQIFFALLKEAGQKWSEDKASRLAAAITYYTVFSLSPLLLLSVAVAGLALEGAQSGLVAQLEQQMGTQIADLVQSLIENASESGGTITILSIGLSLLGASTVFAQLNQALNLIWGVEQGESGLLMLVHTRFLSFGMVLLVGVLLLLALISSTLIHLFTPYLAGWLGDISVYIPLLNFFVSLGLMTLLFAILFRVLPDVRVSWRDVWWGALLTALLFGLARYLIGFYVQASSAGAVYGAAGSLIVLLLWIYYSAQIFLFGAAFTAVYAHRYGSRVQPARYARRRGLRPYEKPTIMTISPELLRPRPVVTWQEKRPYREAASAVLGLALGLLVAWLNALRSKS